MLKKIIHKINNITLQRKLILSFIIVVFVPLLIVGVFLTHELRQISLNNVKEQSTSDMNRIQTRISEALLPAVYLSNQSLADEGLKDLVNREYETVFAVVDAYKNYPVFEHNIRFYNEISNIRLYTNNETMLNNWRFIPVDTEIVRHTWFQQTVEAKGMMRWEYTDHLNGRFDTNLSLTRYLNFQDDLYGVLVIDVNTDYLNWILSQEVLPTMIVNSDNQIVSSNKLDLIGRNLNEDTFSNKLIKGEIGIFEDTVFGESSQIMVEPIQFEYSTNQLRIVSVLPNSEIIADANRLSRLGFIIMFISSIIALILIYVFSHFITRRMLTLSKQITNVTEGNLSTEFKIAGKDEIGQLSSQFNKMTLSIQQLLKEVEAKNEEKRVLEKRQGEIKFKMLASQINPHFLFNTLETIRMKAHMRGEKDISLIVKLLGKLLRTSLEVGSSFVSLKQEMDMVKSYLDIQSFRFQERLEYELVIDETITNIQIPPLIIQPLVENAVIHGLENHAVGGKVIVEAKNQGEWIQINVIDNGVGFTAERRQRIIESLTSTDEEHRIGLRNVHERIILSFQQSEGLIIESERDKGTCVSFRIPRQSEGDLYDV
ncbi:sensor histidine kinase [Alkalihalobacillus hemicellulosilyticus]|uniref:Two-component sensor histidine kinase n=1 Tax=Halalkalibacter hemicellulosilyticusJCM 9152 TaxID=1236971 RepID=W4QKL2_9BACI|nr:histidine kinase [Halalkalibacter hemicellulosilyticus]GAE32665.1 two-component sensor histidine kinase [Halalkalibacter hemicellulosilyticusJCM 9152]